MKVPIITTGSFAELIAGDEFRGSNRKIMQDLFDSVIFENPEPFRRAILNIPDAGVISILNDLKEYICWKVCEQDAYAIDVTGHADGLMGIANDEEIEKAIKHASTSFKKNENLVAAYTRKIKPLIDRATRVEVVDSYAGENLINGNIGASWFAKRALENPKLQLVFYCADPQSSAKLPGTIQSRRDKVAAAIRDLVLAQHDFEGAIRVNFVSNRLLPHNRRLGFRFDSGQTVTLLEHGLSVFDKDPIEESHEFPLADIQDFKALISELNADKHIYQLVVTHNEVCQTCSK